MTKTKNCNAKCVYNHEISKEIKRKAPPEELEKTIAFEKVNFNDCKQRELEEITENKSLFLLETEADTNPRQELAEVKDNPSTHIKEHIGDCCACVPKYFNTTDIANFIKTMGNILIYRGYTHSASD